MHPFQALSDANAPGGNAGEAAIAIAAAGHSNNNRRAAAAAPRPLRIGTASRFMGEAIHPARSKAIPNGDFETSRVIEDPRCMTTGIEALSRHGTGCGALARASTNGSSPSVMPWAWYR